MPIFKRSGNSIFGVQFNAKEQKALREEIQKQVLAEFRQNEMDLECSVLWMLHTYFGFGAERLKKAWRLFYKQNRDYEKHYELNGGDGAWLCRKNLKDYGCDVEEWWQEEIRNEL